jgi:hypothetical protein
MRFYVGMHHPSKADKVQRAFISVHAIENRRSPHGQIRRE